jgi:hypothetical protein
MRNTTHDVPTQIEEPPLPVEPLSPTSYALLSVLVPGLGQLAQRRPLTAALQFGTVVAYLGSAYAMGGGRALWLAVLWNAWSAVEAWWRSPR